MKMMSAVRNGHFGTATGRGNGEFAAAGFTGVSGGRGFRFRFLTHADGTVPIGMPPVNGQSSGGVAH